jgi:hypothetical protein
MICNCTLKRNEITFIISMLFLSVSCGQKPNTITMSKTPHKESSNTLLNTNDEGVYQAKLIPINNSIADQVLGNVTVSIKGDDLRVTSQLEGIAPGVKHFQSIQVGSNCPNSKSDNNQDGIVDFFEGLRSYGGSLIPLDGNLETQYEGASFGPIANEEGHYFYSKAASFGLFMNDLRGWDNDLEDSVNKLGETEKLLLANRVVVVYGVSPETHFPDSVGSTQDHLIFESIPVACGKLARLE